MQLNDSFWFVRPSVHPLTHTHPEAKSGQRRRDDVGIVHGNLGLSTVASLGVAVVDGAALELAAVDGVGTGIHLDVACAPDSGVGVDEGVAVDRERPVWVARVLDRRRRSAQIA